MAILIKYIPKQYSFYYIVFITILFPTISLSIDWPQLPFVASLVFGYLTKRFYEDKKDEKNEEKMKKL